MKKALMMLSLGAITGLLAQKLFGREAREDAVRAADTRTHLRHPVSNGPEMMALDALVADDGEVLDVLAGFDGHQIAAAELALSRPLGPQAQALASMLYEDHQLHLQRTRDLLDQLNLVPHPGSSALADLEESGLRRRQMLQATNADEFEQRWLDQLIHEHEHMIDVIDLNLVAVASDGRVRETLIRSRDQLASHLAEARMAA